ncbi:MAG: peptidylprolyl isomerase [Flavobacteriales bacterium]|jgi:cyclophilin family peptidyl-prolyl cis-trans isomerase
MRFLRKIALFCVVVTLIQCAGLRKTPKIALEPLLKITTPMGEMFVELSDKTPLHKANFIKLVNAGFYDSLLFHRVINNFMIQGGDPDSKFAKSGAQLGNGGPGYRIPAEFDSTLFHKKGALATARLGDAQNPKKESSGSQFYLAQGRVYTIEQLKRIEESKRKTTPSMNMEEIPDFKFTEEQIEAYTTVGGVPFLDAGYTVFGQVVKGIEVIDKIAAVKVNKANGNRPADDVRMKIEMIYLSKEDKATLLNKEEK